eukprot:3289824-Pleurochrysis_carterae.AAC.1
MLMLPSKVLMLTWKVLILAFKLLMLTFKESMHQAKREHMQPEADEVKSGNRKHECLQCAPRCVGATAVRCASGCARALGRRRRRGLSSSVTASLEALLRLEICGSRKR